MREKVHYVKGLHVRKYQSFLSARVQIPSLQAKFDPLILYQFLVPLRKYFYVT
jgi:hypothetical protein